MTSGQKLTQEKILNAAIELFAEKGFDGTSVKDIAERSGMNISLVSYHFGGKEGLYRKCIEDFGKQNLEIAERILSAEKSPESPSEFHFRMKQFFEELISVHLKNPGPSQILHRECDMKLCHSYELFKSTFLRVFSLFQNFIGRGQQLGFVKKSLDEQITAGVLMGSLIHLLRSDFISKRIFGRTLENPKHAQACIDHITQIAFAGLLEGAEDSSPIASSAVSQAANRGADPIQHSKNQKRTPVNSTKQKRRKDASPSRSLWTKSLFIFFPLLGAAFLGALLPARAAPSNGLANGLAYGLQEFLAEVIDRNDNAKSALKSEAAAELKLSEASLVTGPQASFFGQWKQDGAPPQIPIFTYDHQTTWVGQAAIQKQWSFGLKSKLSYNLTFIDFSGLSSPLFAALNPNALSAFSSGSSSLTGPITALNFELSYPLWGNGFGRGIRATQALLESQHEVTRHQSRFQLQMLKMEAEMAYWRLSAAREILIRSEKNLDRARKSQEWSARRARLELGETSDLYQANSLLQLRTLEHQKAQDSLRSAALQFNTLRGRDSDQVTESLIPLPAPVASSQTLQGIEMDREDLKALDAQIDLIRARKVQTVENFRPQLDAFASTALNGRDPSLGTAVAQTFSLNFPTFAVGLQLTAPLAIGTVNRVKQGYELEVQAAELQLTRKRFEATSLLQDLQKQFKESMDRYAIYVDLEKTQNQKLSAERARLNSGRSTLFQVLSFESDATQAELGRIQTQMEALALQAQLKLFTSNKESK